MILLLRVINARVDYEEFDGESMMDFMNGCFFDIKTHSRNVYFNADDDIEVQNVEQMKCLFLALPI